MKLKGISWFEQHVEKVVLGAVAAIFLAVVALQLVWQPNRVTVGKAGPVPPGEAFQPAEAKARELQAVINRTDVGNLPPPVSATLAEDFVNQHGAPIAAPIPVALGPAPAITGGSDAPLANGVGGASAAKLGALAVPATTTPVAHAIRVTVDPSERVAHPELAKVLPAQQPFDVATVSVEAKFNGAALRAALMADPDGSGPLRPIPQTWWSGNVDALGVVLERQEQKSDGSWGDAVEVPAIPGRPALVAKARGVKTPAEMGEVIGEVRVVGAEALRPTFLRTVAGASWRPPEAASKTGDGVNSPEVDRLLRLRQERITGQERLRKSIEAEQAKPAAGQGGSGGGGSGGGGGRGGGGGGAPPGGGSGGQPQRDPRDVNIENMQKSIDRLVSEQQRYEADIRRLGGKIPGDVEQQPAAGANEPAKGAKPLLEDEAVQVWAHDLGAAAGKTYRYRLAVAINNPVFGRSAALAAEQAELAKQPVVVGAPSAWSEPVRVPSDRYMLLTSASPADGLGSGRASIEVYQFFYGFYRKGNATIEPGDTVAVTGLKLPDDRNKLPVWDLEKIAAGQPMTTGQPNQPATGQPGTAQPGSGRPGGGGGGRLGGGSGKIGESSPAAPGGGAAPAAGGAAAAVVLPDSAKPWAGSLDVVMDLVLVDVRASALDGTPEAVFVTGDGKLLTRSLEADRGEPMVRALQKSARDGENQGAPVMKPAAEPGRNPNQNPAGNPGREDRPPAGGGGGGGPGGG